ncbi:MAG: hypothetical protein OEV38_17950 [Nitrospira sp.]|nr:hypothetical protein [Nitrospira sp.]
MDWLTFISSVVASVAWPGVLVGILIWLRKPLATLVTALRSARFKDLELSFSKKLDELEGKAEQAKLPAPGTRPAWVYENPDDWTFGDYIERLAPISPRAAISEAWRHVELALKAAATRSGGKPPTRTTDSAQSLQQEGLLPRDAASLVEDLRALRNRAVHADDFDIDPERAIEFARLAERVIASIRPPGAAAATASQGTGG